MSYNVNPQILVDILQYVVTSGIRFKANKMSDTIKAAIEELTRKLEQKMREVADLKRAINIMAREAGDSAPYDDAEPEAARLPRNDARPDRFYGKPPTTAAREFLEERQKPASAEEVLRALEEGAFDFAAQGWENEKLRLRYLAISLSKNSAIFTKLPNGLFGLAKWYPGAKKPKAKGEGEPENGAAAQANGGDGGGEAESGGED